MTPVTINTIWKYAIPYGQGMTDFDMPVGATIVSADKDPAHDGWLAVWAMVNPTAPVAKRTILVTGTGHPVDGPSTYHFIGTVIDGPFAWHVGEYAP